MTNVLLITTDQQRADSIGAYGNPVCQTPNLDRLAAAGTRFDSCRTQHPFCQPARATILTGQYPSTHGVVFNGFDLPNTIVNFMLPRGTVLGDPNGGEQLALSSKAIPQEEAEDSTGGLGGYHGPHLYRLPHVHRRYRGPRLRRDRAACRQPRPPWQPSAVQRQW